MHEHVRSYPAFLKQSLTVETQNNVRRTNIVFLQHMGRKLGVTKNTLNLFCISRAHIEASHLFLNVHEVEKLFINRYFFSLNTVSV